ncbi:MAG: AAA family ATPase [Bacteroidales bacterium]
MIYPPTFPTGKNEPAEEQVYNALKKLDMERYDVFYNRRFTGMNPGEKKSYETDFIIADLAGGRCHSLLVLEVKGGIVKYDGQLSQWTQNGHPMSDTKDPVTQAEGNMHSLARHYPRLSSFVPFGWAVCFPDPRNTYSRKQIPPFLHELQLIENFNLGMLDRHLPNLLNFIKEQNPQYRGTDMETYRQFKESLLAGLGHVVPLHTRLEAEERQLIQLTHEQLNLLQLVADNTSLAITGPAGCGKTIMATTLARQAREEGLKVLLLTFNRIPAANIRRGFGLTGEEEDITVENYHRFARQQIEKAEPGWFDEHVKKADELFWTMETALKLSEVLHDPCYDVLIIDEAQDFRPEWFESLTKVLKPDGKYFLFMDQDQNIFSHFQGLPGNRHFFRFALPHNCRNTRQIIQLLEQYIEKKISCPEATPDGQPVTFYHYSNDVEQVRILRDEWLRLVNTEKISPDRIVIILNTKFEESCLKDVKTFGKWPLQQISTDTGHISPHHVNLTRIRTFKGLEADMVFIADTDKMETRNKNVLYTQASRARLWLGVMGKH